MKFPVLKPILNAFEIDRTAPQSGFTQGLVEIMQIIKIALDISITIVVF